MSKPASESPGKNAHSVTKGKEEYKLERKHRHSLQPKSETEIPPTSLRHTQSHRYDSQSKKKSKGPVTVSQIASILEAENSEEEIEKSTEMRKDKVKTATVAYENERKSSKHNKPKKNESSSSKAMFSFENSAFEGNMSSKRNSNTTIRTNSSRAPSIQSLEVVREQYCCCAKRTKCERILLTVVTILTIVIVVLVIVVVILAQSHNLDELKSSYLRL